MQKATEPEKKFEIPEELSTIAAILYNWDSHLRQLQKPAGYYGACEHRYGSHFQNIDHKGKALLILQLAGRVLDEIDRKEYHATTSTQINLAEREIQKL